jgi:hypothetical protein
MDGKGPLSSEHKYAPNFPRFSLLLCGERRKSDTGEAYILNFTYEDDLKIKNKHVAGVSRTFYLSTETISRPPQSREPIPLMTPNKRSKLRII